MKKNLAVFIFLFFIAGSFTVYPQEDTRKYKLEEIIDIAQQKSPDALLAKHIFRSNYWEYQTFLATFKPTLDLNATMPSINRSISKITLPDGKEAFIEQSLANYSMDMSLSKIIGITGGEIYVSSGAERIDILGDSIYTSYLSNPVTLGYNQPLLSFNEYKWQKKVEPLKYKEAQRAFLEDMEDIAMKATNYYFDLLLSQINAEIAKVNKSNNDTLFKIAQGRYNYGKIAENELLQMELSLLNSSLQLDEALIDLQYKTYKLKSFLGIKEDYAIELRIPHHTLNIKINHDLALQQALHNRSDALAYQRRLIEAEREVARAKAENRFNANLYAQYGLTQSTNVFEEIYQNPQDQQQIALGLQVPILDWGQRKGQIKLAQSQQEVIQTNVAQERIDFEQEIFLEVMQFNQQDQRLLIAAKADTIGAKRYHVTKQRYLIGKIDITELNIALTEKDAAKRDYISALRNYWTSYYNLRKLSLFDFVNNSTLKFKIEDI